MKRKASQGYAMNSMNVCDTSVINQLWERAELFPVQFNHTLLLSDEQRQLLHLFG